MAETQMMNVKYAGNNDPRDATAAIRLRGRAGIDLGGVGKVTPAEFAVLTERGLTLEVLTASEAKEEARADMPDFNSMPSSQLQEMATAQGLDVKGTGAGGNVTKSDLVGALEASFTSQS